LSSNIFELQSYIESIEQDPSLYQEQNFEQRIEVIDFIGFQVIEQLEELLQKTDQPDKLALLKYRAEKVKTALEDIDTALFRRLQAAIRTGKKFRDLIDEYVDRSATHAIQKEIGYDNLDIFINGLSPCQTMSEPTKVLEPEMVFYQKTPARIVFELVENVSFMEGDVFFDLGAGLGQVVILVNLLTGVKAKGIEFEPAFYDYARELATELNLSDVTFLNMDAREADYSEGTIFFMFTPFKGEIMQAVLARLREESLRRKIRVITYGPCTDQVALQDWLEIVSPEVDNLYTLGVFRSF